MTLSNARYDSVRIDTKLLHVSNKCGSFQTQPRCSAVGPADAPAGFLEGLDNLLPA